MLDVPPRLAAALADRYRIEWELGRGGMATVYLAHDLKHDRRVAIKVLNPELGPTLGGERFLREVQIAAQLHHPHVVGLIDSGEASGLLFYVMPYVDGESLRQRLDREGALPVAEAVRILREVADALSAAHARGVVHRDIKPENVMLEGRHAMVMDFGVAKAVTACCEPEALTTVGLSLGTPAYMAPEQAAADPNIDHRADLYALGVLGYELLAGRPPFADRSPQEILAAHVTQAPTPVTERCASLPPDLAALIMRCLAKHVEDRPQSADDIVALLEDPGTSSGGTDGVTKPERRGSRRRLGISLAALVLIIGGWGLWRYRGAGAPRGAADVIAVMPFSVRGDPDLDYLGQGIVNLLSTGMDGAGGLRSVNPHALLGYVDDSAGMADISQARETAAHFGAGLFVVGDILDLGDRVRLSASLFGQAGEARSLVDATVEGMTDSVVQLVDDLAARLLARQSVKAGAKITEAAAATTTSLPALKAYLGGEAAYRAGRYGAAIRAFQQAVAVDSTFSLAFYRLSMAQERIASPVDQIRASAEAAFRHSSRLSQHDREFLEAVLASRRGQAVAAERQFRQLLRSYPDDAEAWYQLGELVFHRRPLLGGSITDAREPFTEALRYDPTNIGALYHLMRVVAREQDFVALDSLSERYFALSPTGERNLELRGLRAYSRGDSAAIARIEADLASASASSIILAVWSIAVFTQEIPAARRVSEVLVQPNRSAEARGLGYQNLAYLDLAQGKWASSREDLEASRRTGASDAPVIQPWMAALPFAPVSPAELRAARRRLERWGAVNYQPNWTGFYEVHIGLYPYLKLYLLGLLDARLGDHRSALARADSLGAVRDEPENVQTANELALSLRAQTLLDRGQPETALAVLDSLQFESWYGLTFYSGFYGGILARFTKAGLLRRAGRLEEALDWYDGLGQNGVADLAFLGPATLARAEIYDQLGRADEAVETYGRFLDLWGNGDPVFDQMVERARTRRAELLKTRG